MTTVVAIIEGVDRTLLKKIIGRVRLPWFEAAFEKKAYFLLSSGAVPYEAPNMTSALSGVTPGEHGVFSLWSACYAQGTPMVLSAEDVQAPRIWEWPELKDKTFGLANLHLTHPPRELNGFCLSYLMHQTLNFTHPRDLARRLLADGFRYGHDVSALYTGQPADTFFHEVQRISQYQLDAALQLGKGVDVLIINITLADRLSHFLWPGADAGTASLEDTHLVRAYRFIDEALQRLDRLRRPHDAMLVFSEMGFGKLVHFASLDDGLHSLGLQARDERGDIDEARSIAREAVQGTHGVNLIRRAPGDMPSSDCVQQVCEALLSLRFEDSGTPMVSQALPREAVFAGPYAHLAPDIVIEPADPQRPPMGDRRWAAKVHRHLQNGWHRKGGFGFLLSERAPERPFGDMEHAAECIAPTIAELLGREAPSHCAAPSLIRC